MKKILVFASGDQVGGGSGFQEMVERSRTNPPILDAEIIAVVSNHADGGVRKKAAALNIPFIYFLGPFKKENYQDLKEKYQKIVKTSKPDFVMCSGWLKPVIGLSEKTTVNIHPGPLPLFGGKGMYGHHVHEAVIAAYQRGEIKQSAVSFHFINEKYDCGAGIVQIPVPIRSDDDAVSLAARVLKVEHNYQSLVLNEIVHNRILLEKSTVYFLDKNLARFAFLNK